MNDEKKAALSEAVEVFETLLKNRKWAAGDSFTVADISICISFCQLEAFEFDFHEQKKTNVWYKAVQKKLEPYGYKVNSFEYYPKLDLLIQNNINLKEINHPVMEQWRDNLKAKLDTVT